MKQFVSIHRQRPKSGNREVQELLDEFFEAGWSIEQNGSNHWKLVTPNGLATGFCSGTPSCRHATNQARRSLKKVLALSLEREKSYQPPTPPEERARREQKDERAMQTLKHSPFAAIASARPKVAGFPLPKPLPVPIPKPLPALVEDPELTAKPDMNIQTARSRVRRLMDEGKSAEDATTVVTSAFRIVSGFGLEVSREKLLELANKPISGYTGKHKEEKKEAKVAKEPKPEKASVRKAHTDEEIDEKLAHVRSVLTLPFDKDKKMTIIIDLLQELL